eukprot:6204959-Pleurochrysis_carterae.AAC.7
MDGEDSSVLGHRCGRSCARSAALAPRCCRPTPARVHTEMFWNPVTRWATSQLNRLTSFVPPPPKEESEPARRILLVHAHPCPDSFSNALADAVEAGAKEGGHT